MYFFPYLLTPVIILIRPLYFLLISLSKYSTLYYSLAAFQLHLILYHVHPAVLVFGHQNVCYNNNYLITFSALALPLFPDIYAFPDILLIHRSILLLSSLSDSGISRLYTVHTSRIQAISLCSHYLRPFQVRILSF